MSAFSSWWSERFGDTPPLGHCLRERFKERWLRLHSLPQAKRYAETASEAGEVRRRAWVCASELLWKTQPLWMVTGEYADAQPSLALHSRIFELAGVFPLPDPIGQSPFTAYVARAIWPDDDFFWLIDAVAAGEQRVLWVSETSGEIFAPYDGGIDLIVDNRMRRAALRRVFADWVSKRPDGL